MNYINAVLRIQEPVPFNPWIRDLGREKTGSGSGMKNPDHISESLETICWVSIFKFSYPDLGSGMEKVRIRDPGWKSSDRNGKPSDPGSRMKEILIRDGKILLRVGKVRIRDVKNFGSGINISDP
jgi:hypothetical protein